MIKGNTMLNRSELEIVNGVLTSLNERTVPSLDNLGNNSTIAGIRNILTRRTDSILSAGWWFNTETITLQPTVEKELVLPQNTLSIMSNRYIKRDGKVYDKTNNTSEFTSSITVNIILDVNYTDMPSEAYHYISSMTTIDALDAMDGDQTAISLATSRALRDHRDLVSKNITMQGQTLLNISEIQQTRAKL